MQLHYPFAFAIMDNALCLCIIHYFLHYPLSVSCPYLTPATLTIRRPAVPVEDRQADAVSAAADEWKRRLSEAVSAVQQWPKGEAAGALEADPLYNTARSDAGRRTVSCINVHYSLLGMHYSTCFIPHSIFGVSRG